MSELYDADILEWSERQARLLRGIAAGRPGNEAPDWENIIEEVESVGRSELHAVESLLLQTLIHRLKAMAWPQAPYVPHWEAEARVFRRTAAKNYAPSMRQKIDVADLYRGALEGLPTTVDGQAPERVPDQCPYTLDELLS